MIICIVGPSCAGKTTAAKFIAANSDFEHIEASDFVYKRYDESSSGKDIIDYVTTEFSTKGMDTFAKDVVAHIGPSPDKNTIICGFRAREEVRYTRENCDEVTIVGIFANNLLRYQRKLKRDSPSEDYTYSEFISKDFQEYGFGIIDLLREEAAHLIINEGPIQEFEDKLVELLDL